jgi:type VI secretion system secreted protein Hcp
MNVTKCLAAASFVLALTATTGALAAPPLPSVGTLTIPAPFGSSSVLAWSWGASNSGTTSGGGGGGAGKANVQDLSITRNADGQSPLFFDYVARGRHLPTVVLVDGSTTIALTEVLVTSYSTGDSPDRKNTAQSENITFNFARIAYTVNGVTTCFNIASNTSC